MRTRHNTRVITYHCAAAEMSIFCLDVSPWRLLRRWFNHYDDEHRALWSNYLRPTIADTDPYKQDDLVVYVLSGMDQASFNKLRIEAGRDRSKWPSLMDAIQGVTVVAPRFAAADMVDGKKVTDDCEVTSALIAARASHMLIVQVTSSWRRKGVGRSLVAFVVDQHGHNPIVADAIHDTSQHILSSAGFVTVRQSLAGFQNTMVRDSDGEVPERALYHCESLFTRSVWV